MSQQSLYWKTSHPISPNKRQQSSCLLGCSLCSTGLLPSSPVTSTGPCSQPWLATSLSLWVCCWRTARVWGISCRMRKPCASSTDSCRAAFFSASWPSGSTVLAASGGPPLASGPGLTQVKWSPWPMCLTRCATCWAVSPTPSILPPLQ